MKIRTIAQYVNDLGFLIQLYQKMFCIQMAKLLLKQFHREQLLEELQMFEMFYYYDQQQRRNQQPCHQLDIFSQSKGIILLSGNAQKNKSVQDTRVQPNTNPHKLYKYGYKTEVDPYNKGLKSYVEDKKQQSLQQVKSCLQFEKVWEVMCQLISNKQFPMLRQQSNFYRSEKVVCSAIIFLNVISTKYPSLINQIFKKQDMYNFIINMTVYKEVKQGSELMFEPRNFYANMKKFYQYWGEKYVKTNDRRSKQLLNKKEMDLNLFSTFLLKKLFLRSIEQALKSNNEGVELDNSDGYDIRSIFTIFLGPRYHSVVIKLRNLRPNVNKVFFQFFYLTFKKCSFSILKNRHCGVVVNISECHWPQKTYKQAINFAISADNPCIRFIAHFISPTNQTFPLSEDTYKFYKIFDRKGEFRNYEVQVDYDYRNKYELQVIQVSKNNPQT